MGGNNLGLDNKNGYQGSIPSAFPLPSLGSLVGRSDRGATGRLQGFNRPFENRNTGQTRSSLAGFDPINDTVLKLLVVGIPVKLIELPI